jgi:hypothetical protein
MRAARWKGKTFRTGLTDAVRDGGRAHMAKRSIAKRKHQEIHPAQKAADEWYFSRHFTENQAETEITAQFSVSDWMFIWVAVSSSRLFTATYEEGTVGNQMGNDPNPMQRIARRIQRMIDAAQPGAPGETPGDEESDFIAAKEQKYKRFWDQSIETKRIISSASTQLPVAAWLHIYSSILLDMKMSPGGIGIRGEILDSLDDLLEHAIHG